GRVLSSLKHGACPNGPRRAVFLTVPYSFRPDERPRSKPPGGKKPLPSETAPAGTAHAAGVSKAPPVPFGENGFPAHETTGGVDRPRRRPRARALHGRER